MRQDAASTFLRASFYHEARTGSQLKKDNGSAVGLVMDWMILSIVSVSVISVTRIMLPVASIFKPLYFVMVTIFLKKRVMRRFVHRVRNS